MSWLPPLRALCVAAGICLAAGAQAVETDPLAMTPTLQEPAAATVADRASEGLYGTIEQALGYVGIRYRRGGSSPETGFDCSGFVGHVFKEGLGLYLPRSSREMSQAGEVVDKSQLQPGDLVFFNTMRRAFSHVGIYLGDNLFVHSPRTGGRVRVEDMSERYWVKRFNGARRIAVE